MDQAAETEEVMRPERWIIGGGLAVLLASAVMLLLGRSEDDPCLSQGREPMRVHDQNPNIYTCDDAVYLPAPHTKTGYKRVKEMRASQIEVLPFKYMRQSGRLFYVTFENYDFDEGTYSFLPIDGIDLATLEIVAEKQLRDKNNNYTVLRDQVLVEPRAQR